MTNTRMTEREGKEKHNMKQLPNRRENEKKAKKERTAITAIPLRPSREGRRVKFFIIGVIPDEESPGLVLAMRKQ